MSAYNPQVAENTSPFINIWANRAEVLIVQLTAGSVRIKLQFNDAAWRFHHKLTQLKPELRKTVTN